MNTDLKEFTYELPDERIARFPLEKRDESKLLVYLKGEISHHIFREIGNFLPAGTLLVFNNTRVIRARLIFHRSTGAKIEIFCIEPDDPVSNISVSLEKKGKILWKCLVGNKDKWRKKKEPLHLVHETGGKTIELTARFAGDKEELSLVEFEWNGDLPFHEILTDFGRVPIPPYLKRQDLPSDANSYQTVFADVNGAVAAPTAGLHFTGSLMEDLKNNGVDFDFITLHVSAGTFQPIKEQNVLNHPMHHEQVVFSRKNIDHLLQPGKKIICTGTTSLRALESLYWFGVKLLNGDSEFNIEKLYPYSQKKATPGKTEALSAVREYMSSNNLEHLVGITSIFIFPGYHFQLTDGLITNYHQPQSTLLLLIAAFAGNDWKRIYGEALRNGYRFLSYGDSSLLLP